MKAILLCLSLAILSQVSAQDTKWKPGIELGTGLSFTGYNANLAYTGTFGKNVFFAGPKLVYSDANTFFDASWGLHAGYRRIFEISSRFSAFAAFEYQMLLFDYNDLSTNTLNSVQEFHLSYGFQYFINTHWSVGNSIGAGGYIERLIDPFDGRVDVFSGYSAHLRIFFGYHF